ncbi:MAG: hypothetical protein BGN88_01405 [Clostridiales bacterium 43-6]|nr:MAG: hypothetical protein BGN88_01405 [Clostridiales bacterium 43-6]
MNKQKLSAKDFLSQAYRIDQRIDSKIEQVSSLHDLAAKATSTLSDVPPSGTRNIRRMEDIICKIVDLEAEINSDIYSLVDLKRKIIEVIKSVSNTEYQTILELRYLCFKTWEQIAVDMCYSIHHLYKMHNAALEVCNWILNRDT